ncbi:MAG TPA: beta-ketoacyl-[acyl-carrier-protein] synthase family protein, partial [Planctomycetaceae bacterium]|nr:beta-ketoacyl-[acyl-carrier-protein] synthase family protein [Planctomycetaceae bacterium]
AVHHASERQVVITGVGVVSPIGIGVDDFWSQLKTGTSGIRAIETVPYSPVPGQIGGEVRGFNPSQFTTTREQKKAIRVMCREIQLGFAAATLALADAGIKEGSLAPERLGVEFGANLMLSPPDDLIEACFAAMDPGDHKFHYERWGDQGLSKMFPLWLLKYLPNMPACHIGIAADARGPNNSITLDEASANLVIGDALRVIARGHAAVMITGSTGTRLHEVKSIHARMWDQLAEATGEPAAACRPFDKNRTGQVVGEGSGVLILEDADHAARRGARVYGRILGAGSTCVSKPGARGDSRRALAIAMKSALADAGLEPREIGHINAHGLATTASDIEEAQAIHDVFGDYAAKVPVTAIKSYLGNSAAGCGSLEMAASLLALQHGVIPPTLNYETPDPEIRLNVVSGKPLETKNRTFLKVNVTRMGQASAVVAAGA